MDNKLINYGYFLLYLLGIMLLATVCNGIKINNIDVPNTYLLDNQENSEPLILDCDYDLNPNDEADFVLKWLFNDQSIYQWIPSKKQHPNAMLHMKNHINLNYTASDETYYKYRALSIPKPSINMSGIYTCYVSSYTTEDKKSAHLQIIVPESDIQIKVTTPDIEGNIKVECIVKDIYPAPIVSIIFGENETNVETLSHQTLDATDGLYDIFQMGTVKHNVTDPTAIDCIVKINGTDYVRRKETSHYSNKSEKHTISSTSGLIAAITLLFTTQILIFV